MNNRHKLETVYSTTSLLQSSSNFGGSYYHEEGGVVTGVGDNITESLRGTVIKTQGPLVGRVLKLL